MRAIITVVGKDRVGIISEISSILANKKVNILDVEQTIFDNNFSMMMHIELPKKISFKTLKSKLKSKQEKLKLEINLYNEMIFKKMHNL